MRGEGGQETEKKRTYLREWSVRRRESVAEVDGSVHSESGPNPNRLAARSYYLVGR